MELDPGDLDSWWFDDRQGHEPPTCYLGLAANPTERWPLKELVSAENKLREGGAGADDGLAGFDVSDELEEEERGDQSSKGGAGPEFEFWEDDLESNLGRVADNLSEEQIDVLVDSSDTGPDLVSNPDDQPDDLDELTFSDEELDTPNQLTTTDPTPLHSQQSSSSANLTSSDQSIPRKRSSLGPLDLNSLQCHLSGPPSLVLARQPYATNPLKQLRLSPADPNQAEMDKFFGFVAPTAAASILEEPAALNDLILEDFSDEGADDEMDEIVSVEDSGDKGEAEEAAVELEGAQQARTRAAKGPVKARVGKEQGWKLEQVGAKNTATGAEWAVDDKR